MVKNIKIVSCLFLSLTSVLVISSHVNLNSANSDYNYEDFVLNDQYFDTTEFEFNLEPNDPERELKYLQDFPMTEKSQELNVTLNSQITRYQVVLNQYQNQFDRFYPLGSNYSEIFEDSAKTLNSKESKNSSPKIEIEKLRSFPYHTFPGLSEIKKHLEELEKFSRGQAMIFPLKYHDSSWKIVKTKSGNEIFSIRISEKNDLKGRPQNPIIVVVAGIHGRDWYSVQSAIFLATELIIDGNRGKRGNFEWFIVPVLNPDEYDRSKSDTNKKYNQENLATSNQTDKGCIDLDLDLNFEYQWYKCEEKFCDKKFSGVPFSSPESRGLRDTLEAFSDFVDSFIALKEGKEMLVYPFADTLRYPRYDKEFDKICLTAIKAFNKHVEGFYDCGQSSHLMNLTAGFIEDWAKVHVGVEKSFAFYLGPIKKDRRELASQHLKDHMNGSFDLINIIARTRINEKITNGSSKICLSPILLLSIFPIIEMNFFIKINKHIFE